MPSAACQLLHACMWTFMECSCATTSTIGSSVSATATALKSLICIWMGSCDLLWSGMSLMSARLNWQ